MSLGYHEVEKGSVREQMMLPAPTRYLHVVGNGLLHCPPVSPLPPLRQLFELESPFLLTPWHLKSSVHSRWVVAAATARCAVGITERST